MVKLVTIQGTAHWMIDFSPIAFVLVAADPTDFAQIKADMEAIISKAAKPQIADEQDKEG